MPETDAFEPWVKCPPEFKLIPKIVSPGFNNAKKTAPLACAPECGWTFANLQLNNFLTLSIAKLSAVSTWSHPL